MTLPNLAGMVVTENSQHGKKTDVEVLHYHNYIISKVIMLRRKGYFNKKILVGPYAQYTHP